MLELSSYSSMVEASQALANWLEQAREGLDFPKEPANELVLQFQDALEGISKNEAAPSVQMQPSGQSVESIFEQSSFFPSKVDQSSREAGVQSVQKKDSGEDVSLPGRDFTTVTDAENIHLKKGMDALDAVASNKDYPLEEGVQNLFNILSKKAENLSPLDLLQAQRYVGMLSFTTESGKKASEGVSEVIETTLDMEG